MKEDTDSKKMQIAKEWLEGLAQGRGGREIETRALQNLLSVRVHRGLIHCNFIIPKSLSDRDGNWHVGAIATLIDVVGSAAIVSCVGIIKVSVDFNISYFSTAKIDEEVEIEAKVLGHKGKLSLNTVEIRKKGSGEMIAFGKQWMSSINPNIINVDPIQDTKKFLEGLAKGGLGGELDRQALQNLHSIRVHKGLIHCNFVVPRSLSDRDGNWHVGAIAMLIDVISAAVINSSVGDVKISVDFNISYFSMAKIDVLIVPPFIYSLN
ncbi:Thioesterase superfamily [Macleaya cordata]|uniref:Acyl-coenzyme A thioesterase 13 n=1 Tax=Macleaya cordata TaxID=56857 RepID=A0A200QDX6_MACCD|nr:Thioesterase superfamily [Macleaya cordata]